MRALLRADWLRFRRRRDLWIIGIAVCVIAAVSFLNGYKSDVEDPTQDDPAYLRSLFASGFSSEGLTQAEIDAQIEQMVQDQLGQERAQLAQRNEQQKTTLQAYAFPQSIFTMVGPGLVPLLALVLIASFAVGDEFRFGTIRTSLLAAGDRRRFLIARMLALLAMTTGLLAALLLVGAVLGAALAALGAELAPSTVTIDAVSSVAWFAGQILATIVVLALGTAVTVLLRSGALTLLLILVGSFVELFVANLPFFAPGQVLAGIPAAFLTTNLRTLIADLGQATHAVGLAALEPPPRAVELPTLGVAAVVGAWGLLFLLLADRRLRTMDVVE
jgi:ABC-type transport system involved in multi-copper enzyme maturation permease subunit